MTEILIYLAFLAVVFLLFVMGRNRNGRGLTPTRSLRSSDVTHAIRRRQRPR